MCCTLQLKYYYKCTLLLRTVCMHEFNYSFENCVMILSNDSLFNQMIW